MIYLLSFGLKHQVASVESSEQDKNNDCFKFQVTL
jgi:hypothetical protein